MAKAQLPSTTGTNGRSKGGQFAKGNRAASGNPHAQRAAKLRSAVLASVNSSDIKAVIRKLVEMAKGGDVQAMKLLLDRACGKLTTGGTVPDVPADAGPDKKNQARVMLLSMGRASNAG